MHSPFSLTFTLPLKKKERKSYSKSTSDLSWKIEMVDGLLEHSRLVVFQALHISVWLESSYVVGGMINKFIHCIWCGIWDWPLSCLIWYLLFALVMQHFWFYKNNHAFYNVWNALLFVVIRGLQVGLPRQLTQCAMGSVEILQGIFYGWCCEGENCSLSRRKEFHVSVVAGTYPYVYYSRTRAEMRWWVHSSVNFTT